VAAARKRGSQPGEEAAAAATESASLEDDRALLRRVHERGDAAAREALVDRYLPLAHRLANRYRHTNEEIEDLRQVASVALVKAVDRFDPDRGTAFSSFAVPTILGELKRHFRDHGWAVRVPRELQERATKVGGVIETLSKQHGRPPSVREVAKKLGVSVEEALEAMQASEVYDSISLDSGPGDAEESMAPMETLGEEEPGYDVVEYGAAIEGVLEHLPRRDRIVLHLRFVHDMTQSEIAARIGVSQMQVSRLLRRAVARLREAAAAEEGGGEKVE
jgi:RNA polymerase sigma-B factor